MEILGFVTEFLICGFSLYIFLLFSGAIKIADPKTRNTITTISANSGRMIKWLALVLFGLMTLSLILHLVKFFSR